MTEETNEQGREVGAEPQDELVNSPRCSSLLKFGFFTGSILEEMFKPRHFDDNVIKRIGNGVERYQDVVRDEMIRKSICLPQVRWAYKGTEGIFSKGENVNLALVIPRRIPRSWEDGKFVSTKYILATDENNKQVIVSLPYGLHRDIKYNYERMSGSELNNISGGRISASVEDSPLDVLMLSGSSQDFGSANHDFVANILNGYGLNAQVGMKGGS